MLFLVTTFAFVQTCVVLYVLPLRNTQTRNYPYIKALLLLIIIHLGIKLFLLGVLKNGYLFSRLTSFTTFSYGPLLYFQYRQLVGRSLNWKIQLLHLIPFLAAFGLYTFCVITQLPIQKPVVFESMFAWYANGVLVSLIGYSSYMIWLLRRPAAVPKDDQRFLLQISGLLIAVVLSGMIIKEVSGTLGYDYDPHFMAYIMLGLVSYRCLRFFFIQSAATPAGQPDDAVSQDVTENQVNKDGITYEKSGLSTQQVDALFDTMEQFMQRDKPYLEPELSLDELAARLKSTRQHVSQVLNQKARKNFYAYVNEYRVYEMIQLMKQRPDGRILELAFQAGFQSKTTLNSYFKKVTGFNPTEYQQALSGNTALARLNNNVTLAKG
ncbi:AraC family transcriptional regulator [Fibrisoma montanum]|uniref:AraC family transcriptional regulator n=1 Tax=Fibrisoma montanum TaxID=2305895 RepID=A0A418MFF9_9BACT|nr:AraC family transcriptional regulator [Fibrisoma montanum]RIV25505.1 AraC family transcriptional regulator [Fibrisoma montanum]